MALDRIKLVRNDTLPQVRFQVSDVDKKIPANLAGLTAVFLKFRAAGNPTVLSTISGVWQAAQGLVAFEFPDGALDVPEGDYEGEIEFHFGAKVQTAFDVLRFFVRQDF